MKMLLVVIAKGHSNGLPGKNLRLFSGQPCVKWVLKAAKQSHLATKVILNTDSLEIAKLAEGLVEVQMRPANLCADYLPGWEVVRYAYEQEEREGRHYDLIGELHGNSPMLQGAWLDKAAIMLWNHPNADSIIATKPVPHILTTHSIGDDGFIKRFGPPIMPSGARQNDLAGYVFNGGFFISKLPMSHVPGDPYWTDKTLPFVMAPHDYVDIDEPYEAELAQWLMNVNGPDTRFDNIHRGSRAWIVGTGPSLKQITPEQWKAIDQEITFGVNNAAAYHQTKYLVTGEVEVLNLLPSFINAQVDRKFICNQPDRDLGFEAEICPHVDYPTYKYSQGLMCSGSSTHAALNLALIMGCDPIILLGIDYGRLVHVIPQANDNPDLPYLAAQGGSRTLTSFARFVPHAKELGRTIINANLGSALDCFPKKPLAEILVNGRGN